MKKNTERFSDRVADYTKYRPSYPKELIWHIQGKTQLGSEAIAADIGSGTGIFTELLLGSCKQVYAVEPNTKMREESIRRLKSNSNFIPVNGTAEKTNIEDNGVDFITVAQAFHWFAQGPAKDEFKRILKPQGYVFIIWNKRKLDTPFMIEYDAIIRENISEHKEATHERITEGILEKFFDSDYTKARFEYSQVFDLEGLLGRFMSSSYTPNKNSMAFMEIEKKIKHAFSKHAQGDTINFNYQTEVYCGRLGST